MLENGVLLEGYRIDGLIGEGGMGVVYEATQLSLERKVALKLLSTDLSVDEGFRQRFRVEARIQAAMDHPNIVTVHEAGESEHGLFIAMELIRGATLKDLIVGRELEAGRTLRILSQVADALDTAHEAGLIHRDIKPHNILVRAQRRDHAYLADFGVTKVRGGTNLTRTGQFVGTIDYMAPEQIRGEQATRATDIYALGTVLYECLSGEVPFVKDSDVAVMYAHLADPPPQVTAQRPELPAELDAVISKAMAKNPSERYESAGSMMLAFEEALGEEGKAVATPPGPIEEPEEIGLRLEDTEVTSEPITAASGGVETALGAPLGGEATRAAPVPEVTEVEPVTPVGEATTAAPVIAAPTAAAPAVPATPTVARPTERGRSPLVLIVPVLAILVLAAAGFLVGHSSSSKKASASGFPKVTAGNVSLTVPPTWRKLSAPPHAIPGLPAGTVAIAPSGQASTGTLEVATTSGAWPTLLPAALASKAGSDSSLVAKRQVVSFADGRQALRYPHLSVTGVDRPLTIFVLPQGSRVETLLCAVPTASTAVESDCEGAVASAKLPGTTSYQLVPSAAYSTSLAKALASLSAARSAGVQKLRAAKTGKQQSAAADTVAAAYRSAVGKLGSAAGYPLLTTPDRKLRTTLKLAATAWSDLAAAAAKGNRTIYDSAKHAIGTSDTALKDVLAGFGLVGYRVG